MKEHRGPIRCIKINHDNTQCVTASADGSCIVWDLVRYVRLAAFFDSTVFNAILYHPDESQLLTCGSNHKVSYWDAYDGTAIRVVDGGSAEMTTLDIDPSGHVFVSGGADNVLKVWHYDDGIVVATGRAHSGSICAIRISPSRDRVVTVGGEGGICLWRMPGAEDNSLNGSNQAAEKSTSPDHPSQGQKKSNGGKKNNSGAKATNQSGAAEKKGTGRTSSGRK